MESAGENMDMTEKYETVKIVARTQSTTIMLSKRKQAESDLVIVKACRSVVHWRRHGAFVLIIHDVGSQAEVVYCLCRPSTDGGGLYANWSGRR
jgi:hypothetical protein